MTLKEKFKERLYNQSHDDSECLRIRFENIDKVIDSQEKIADEFALGFLHWYNTSQECETYLRRNYPKNITMNGEHYKKVLEINKELLEIYKTENGL